MTSTPIPIIRRLSDGRCITVNPNGTLLLTYPDGGILITAPNGDQKYVAGTKKGGEGAPPTQGAILSASLNEESEKVQARKLFEQEKARVHEELRNAQHRHKARSGFNAIEFHDQIMDRMDRGTYI